MKVIPTNNINPERITWRFNCSNQYIKNNAFRIRNSGKIKVSTESNGNILGAKNGKT